jgi:dihydrofolate reductase
MVISIIVAMSENRVIGIGGRLPWHLPADMAWFKRHTLGKPVLMGRKTWESIGSPLPGRTNIVLTDQADFRAEGCTVVHGIGEAIEAAGDSEELMVIGGADCYGKMLPLAGRLYITIVHAGIEGDVSFPHYDPAPWIETFHEELAADALHRFDLTFLIMEHAENSR